MIRLTLFTGKQVCSLLIIAVLLAAPGPAPGDPSRGKIDKAQQYFDEQEYRSAVIELKKALQKDPSNGEARALLGRSHLKLGDPRAAEKELLRAKEAGLPRSEWLFSTGLVYLMLGQNSDVLERISAQEGDPPTLLGDISYLRGRAYLATGRPLDAEDSFRRALTVDPGNSRARLGMAHIALQSGEFDRASSIIEDVLNEGENADAWSLKGELFRRQGKSQQALQAFRRAVELEPENLTYRLGKAAAHMALMESDAAIEELEIVRSRWPNQPFVNYMTGLARYQKRDFEYAEIELQRSLRTEPAYVPSHLLLGSIYLKQGQMNQAERQLREFLKVVPNHLPAIKLLGASLIRQRQVPRAVPVLEAGLALDSEDNELLALLGSAYLQSGEVAKAIDYLGKVAESEPQSPVAHVHLARALLANGESAPAVKELEIALELDPGLLQADALLVMSQIQEQNLDRALELSQGLTEEFPQEPVSYDLKGTVLMDKGDAAAARRAFETALGIKEDFIPSRLNLATLDLGEDDVAAAQRQYKRVLDYDAANVEAMLGMASVAAREGRESAAIEWLEKAREQEPAEIEPALRLIDYYLTHDESLKALSTASSLQSLHPRSPLVLRALGVSQLAADIDVSAIGTFQQLTEALPESSEAYYWLARAYAERGDVVAARRNIGSALELDGNFVPAKVLLGELEIKAGNLEAASELAREIQQRYPGRPSGFELSGDLLFAQQQYGSAVQRYLQAYQLKATEAIARKLFRARVSDGQEQQAFDVIEDWLKNDPDNLSLRLMLANEQQNAGYREQAIANYGEVLERDPNNIEALNNIAWAYLEKDYLESLRFADKAYQLKPDSPEVTDTLGWVLVKGGRNERGLALLQDALASAPHLAEIRYHTAVALANAERYDEAALEIDRLIRTDPEFAGTEPVMELRRRLQKGNGNSAP